MSDTPDDYTMSENLQAVMANNLKAPHWYTASDSLVSPTPTLAAALEVPEVKALVEATADYLFWKTQFDHSTHEDVMQSVVIEAHMKDAESLMRATLAALNGGTHGTEQ